MEPASTSPRVDAAGERIGADNLYFRESLMFSHVLVGSNDIEGSRKFYDAVLSVLGLGQGQDNNAPDGRKRIFYRGAGPAFVVVEPLDRQPAIPANGGTIGFSCESPQQVVAFHDAGVAAGGASIEEAPGPRDRPWGVVYAAYLRDPGGNKLCAMYAPPPA